MSIGGERLHKFQDRIIAAHSGRLFERKGRHADLIFVEGDAVKLATYDPEADAI